MKRFFYILFISVTVFFSFGFRGCELLLVSINADFNYHAAGGSGNDIFQIAVGDEGKVSTQIGGLIEDWDPIISGTLQNLNYIRITSTMAVAVGDSGTVLYSTDKGLSWDDRSIAGLTENLYGFDFLPIGLINVVVCGESGTIYKSITSGSGWGWQQINTITNRNLTSIIAITNDFIVAVGDGGTIIRSGDGGQTWENKSVATDVNFNKVFNGGLSFAFGKAWAVADNGKIYYTENYGINWTPRLSGVTENLNDVAFINQNSGIVVGDNCTALYTENGGLTWLEYIIPNNLCQDVDIISLAIIDFNTATAILRNTSSDGALTTSILTVSSEPLAVDDDGNILPSEYSLEQNFPNPFNPNTTIQFSIPEPSFVTLEIFNTLGEKITTLVSEELNAGNHKYDWNVEKMPSGIYLYKLQTSSFTESKKMALLK